MTQSKFVVALFIGLIIFIVPTITTAQDNPITPETIPGDAANGLAIYQERCATCHGATGLGDGELAPQAINPPIAFGTEAYKETADPQMMFDTVVNGRMEAGMPPFGPGTSNPLSEQEVWDVLAAVFQLAELNKPLEEGTITGQVVNATTNEPLPEGTIANLRAFTPNFDMTLSLTTTLDAEGGYSFTVADVPREWVFMAAVTYEDIRFNSQVAQLTVLEPERDLPITVYDQTTDASAIQITQMHLILEFGVDTVRVNQLYLYSNTGNMIYVGESGEPQDGTVRFALPAEASNIQFQRSLNSVNSFVLANDLLPAAGQDWYDVVSVRPGRETLALLAQYDLPYGESVAVDFPLYYDLVGATLIMPSAGIEVNESWQNQGEMNLGEQGFFVQYDHGGAAAGSTLTLNLTGRPRQATDSLGNVVVQRNEQTELIIGSISLIVTAAVVIYVVRTWQEAPTVAGDTQTQSALLEALADLDDAYHNDEIRESVYLRQREQLKAELRARWKS